jgi:hypothetical protein
LPSPEGHEFDAKSTQLTGRVHIAGAAEMISMSDVIRTERVKPAPSIVPTDIPSLSDDECLVRLARAVEAHDSQGLEEVARLIGRLAVTIE